MKSNTIFSYLQKLSRPKSAGEIIVVSGLPRSGTSMMMKILEAGGLDVFTDHERVPDEDNPQGYYEFERVKALRTGDSTWVPMAAGKAVKVISALLEFLPPPYTYKIIFMRRNLDEVLASQRQMLIRSGEDPGKVSDEEMKKLFRAHLEKVETWLAAQPHMQALYLSYNDLLDAPEPHLAQVQAFIGKEMSLPGMAQVIQHSLYRQRSQRVSER